VWAILQCERSLGQYPGNASGSLGWGKSKFHAGARDEGLQRFRPFPVFVCIEIDIDNADPRLGPSAVLGRPVKRFLGLARFACWRPESPLPVVAFCHASRTHSLLNA
jgi:hypothetical protein